MIKSDYDGCETEGILVTMKMIAKVSVIYIPF